MERFDLYTADRERTGRTMLRGEPTPEGFFRLVIHVCIFNAEGRMLIQQRQPFKKGWPGMWDVSVGGCAVAGENSREAAQREVGEELGLAVDLSAARPVLTAHWERGFDDYFVLTREVQPDELRLQAEEVKAARWAERDEIVRMIGDGSFIPYDVSLIDYLFFRRNHGGSLARGEITGK